MTRPLDFRFRVLETTLKVLQGFQYRQLDTVNRLRRRIAFDYRLERRPDDVYISTYPKSGTTLLQMIVHQLRGDGSMDIPHIHSVVPWVETEIIGNNFAFLSSLPSPRVFKTHLTYDQLPRGARYIYVLRDVREVFVSGLHHLSLLTGQDQKADRFIHQFSLGNAHHRSWDRHLASWWRHRADPDVLFFTYEGMIEDLESTVRRVAAFCGLPLDESQMPRILERCSLDFMKRHNDKFDPRFQRTTARQESFIRKGRVGQWQEDLPNAPWGRLEQDARKLAARLGAPGGADPFEYLFRGRPAAASPDLAPSVATG